MEKQIEFTTEMMRGIFDTKRGGFVSLTSPYDEGRSKFLLTPEEFPQFDIEKNQWFGNLTGVVQVAGKSYSFITGDQAKELNQQAEALTVTIPAIKTADQTLAMSITSTFSTQGELLKWHFEIKNNGNIPLTVSELKIPFLMDQYFRGDDEFKYEYCVLRHTCIVGHSSYLYWEKSSGNGPVLLVTPLADTEFIDLQIADDPVFGPAYGEDFTFEGMAEASLIGGEAAFPQAHSPLILAPGESRSFEIGIVMIERADQINDTLNEYGRITLKAVPGMVGPIEKDFQIMTRPVEAEVFLCDAADQIIESNVKNGWRVSRVRFGEYGRRYLQVKAGENIATYCFFGTEPVKAMIAKHADFIAHNHQETDPNDPCYHGLLMWDMQNKQRINSSFNPYFEDWWRGGSDEPGLVSGLFLSEKNVYQPVDFEIKVLNEYVEDFLIERLTEQPGWRVHRMVPWYTMFEFWAGRGADDVWRAFNYVHVINTLRNMYLIQKQNRFANLREATEYLVMAYEYTKAMFNYWMFPNGIGASEIGNMGEMSLPLYLAEDLRKEGLIQEATEMAAIFDKKAHFFNMKQFPFGSEMVYDSTAFEAVYGYGKRIDSDHIMGASARSSYANRGKQPVWFLYCSDVRGGGDSYWNTSYMTQLGAYPILDYALHQGHINEDWIMTYYGAYLAGWLIYNSGGYWSSAQENQGATGWITEAKSINFTGQNVEGGFPFNRGLVMLSGEAELGFFGALRTACSIIIDHSVLGRIGLGCELVTEAEKERYLPQDGLATRFYHVPERWRLEIEGGNVNLIEKTNTELTVEFTMIGEAGVTLSIFTIPQADETMELLQRCHFDKTAKKGKITFKI